MRLVIFVIPCRNFTKNKRNILQETKEMNHSINYCDHPQHKDNRPMTYLLEPFAPCRRTCVILTYLHEYVLNGWLTHYGSNMHMLGQSYQEVHDHHKSTIIKNINFLLIMAFNNICSLILNNNKHYPRKENYKLIYLLVLRN